jgi:glycosyltransferase involved in cell wall biosynthesis
MIKILLPINIDRWRSPIATLLRACAEYNPDFEFTSFSKPETEEDREKGDDFWRLPNVIKGNLGSVLSRSFDIVHIASHTNKNLLAGTLAKMRSFGNTKFLYTINLELESKDKNSFIYKWFNAVVDDYVAVSHAASKLVLQDAPECFHGVIPNGYDSDYFDPQLESNEILPEPMRRLNGAPYVLNVAALETRKHPEWIVAMARSNPDINFVMAGWVVPGLGEAFMEEIRTCGLSNLIWLGHVNRSTIRILLKNASVFAFPSEREGLPLSVIEAMGMGVPVVAQPKSSLPELIVNDDCGCLINIESEDSMLAWSQSLRGYLNFSSEARNHFRNSLSQHARQKYSWASIGRNYCAVYKDITSSKS